MTETYDRASPAERETPKPPLVEIGWLAVGQFDDSQRQSIDAARRKLCSRLDDWLPQFTWRMPLIDREAADDQTPLAPTELLEAGVDERNARHWDYAVVITPAELVSHYKPRAVACISRSLECVVVSLHHLHGITRADVDTLAQRIFALVMHALGHHAGLMHAAATDNVMASIGQVSDLDAASTLSPQQLETLRTEFAEVADNRLEERPDFQRSGSLRFYFGSAWMNRREIAAAIWQARPWEFPYRLSRLTTAAISAVLVLFLTAEAWELAAQQSGGLLSALCAAALLATTTYVLLRQRLLLRGQRALRSEQTVITNLSTTAIVFCGIATTFVCLLALTSAVGWLLFSGGVIRSWTGAPPSAPLPSILKPASLAASLAMFVGALGATFENAAYFQHVTYVDEEI